MALGKLGAFLNKDMGTFAKDARKVLNTDLATLAKGARQVLKTDLGDLLRDTPAVELPADASALIPAAKPANPGASTAEALFDPDITQKLVRAPVSTERTPDPSTTVPPFDPDVTQKMERAPARSADPTEFNQELLLRTLRAAPAGDEVKVLLPYSVGDFERSHATPSGELTNDPVNAVYAGQGETVLVQLALCWDADEAVQLVDAVTAKIETAARTATDRTWVIGPTPQGLMYAWTRDCYFICATSPKGSSTLMRFLSAYPY